MVARRCFLFFFFFQAEDGIRDLTVTGVQTCALPISPDAADQREAAIAKRLDRLSRHAERMERDQNIQIETLALFIRYFLTVSTPVPEAHQDAARAQGKARFEQFVEQLDRKSTRLNSSH